MNPPRWSCIVVECASCGRGVGASCPATLYDALTRPSLLPTAHARGCPDLGWHVCQQCPDTPHLWRACRGSHDEHAKACPELPVHRGWEKCWACSPCVFDVVLTDHVRLAHGAIPETNELAALFSLLVDTASAFIEVTTAANETYSHRRAAALVRDFSRTRRMLQRTPGAVTAAQLSLSLAGLQLYMYVCQSRYTLRCLREGVYRRVATCAPFTTPASTCPKSMDDDKLASPDISRVSTGSTLSLETPRRVCACCMVV